MATHPQKRPATKAQRRHDRRVADFDGLLKDKSARAGSNGMQLIADLAAQGAYHRPGSGKKS